jgi:hypothetical protein
MLDEIVSETERTPTPPALPELPATPAPDAKVQPGAMMFGAVPLRTPEKPGAGPRAAAPEITIKPAEIRGRAPRKEEAASEVSARQGASAFVRALRFGARTVTIVGLCGLAWAGGVYYATGRSPFDVAKSGPALAVQPSAGHDDTLAAMHQMTDEMRNLRADVAQAAGQKAPLNAAPVPAGATTADVIGRIDKLDAEFTAKLSQVDQQLASIEQQMAASHAALVARQAAAAAARKHAKLHLHDAFNPAHDPGAPGAPRPLGMQ